MTSPWSYELFSEEEILPVENAAWSSLLHVRFNNFPGHFLSGPNRLRVQRINTVGTPVRKYPKLQPGIDGVEKVSWAQFYADLDESVAESGTKTEKIEELFYSWKANKSEDDAKTLFELLGPIYKKMRNKGHIKKTMWT